METHKKQMKSKLFVDILAKNYILISHIILLNCGQTIQQNKMRNQNIIFTIPIQNNSYTIQNNRVILIYYMSNFFLNQMIVAMLYIIKIDIFMDA